MHVYWLEQSVADVPIENRWLSDSELAELNSLRFLKRRTDWRLGRWTAKCAVSSFLDLPSRTAILEKIEIRPAPSGAPKVFVESHPDCLEISLSHCAGRALCMVMPAGVKLGCDLEVIEPRSAAFVADYFTAEEQDLISRAPSASSDSLTTLVWSGKESALKARQAGLRLATAEVIVSLGTVSVGADRWSRMEVRHVHGEIFHGWWAKDDNFVRTIVSDSVLECPVPLCRNDWRGQSSHHCA